MASHTSSERGRTSRTSAAPPPGTLTDEPRREDPAAVHHQEVAGGEQVGKIAEDVVTQAARGAIEDEQARGVALGERLLGDAGLGQLVVEVGESQNSFFCGVADGGTRPKCS